MKKTTTTTASAIPSSSTKSKSKKPPCRFKEPEPEPDSTGNRNNINNNNNSDPVSTSTAPSTSQSQSQQRSRSPRTPTPTSNSTQIPTFKPGFIPGVGIGTGSGTTTRFSKKLSTLPLDISSVGIKLPHEKSGSRPTSLPPGVDPKQLFTASSTPPITASSSSTRRRPLKSPRRHKIQLYNARQNRSTARSASPYLCEVVKKSKPKNDAYQEIYVSDREYRLLRIALNLQPLPEPLRPRQNYRKTLFGYIAVPNLDDLPLDLNSNSKSSCGLKRGNNNKNNNNASASGILQPPPQKIKSNNKIKSLEDQANLLPNSNLKYPLNTSSSSNSTSSNNSSSTSLAKSSKKTEGSSTPSKKNQKLKKCLKSQLQRPTKSKSTSKSKSLQLKSNFSSDSESSIKTEQKQKQKCAIENSGGGLDDIQDGVEKWAWRHNLLELVETSASPFVLTLPQEEMLEMLAKESQLHNIKKGKDSDQINSKPSIPAICDMASGPESENELGLEQIEKPVLTLDSDCSTNQIRNLNHSSNYYENNDNGNENGHHQPFENLLGENMKNSIFAASETCMILMHTLFQDAMKDPTIAKNLKGCVPFQNFVESSSGLEALENSAVIFEMAGRRIQSYANQMRKKAGNWSRTGDDYSECQFSNMDEDANGIEEQIENSSQICDVTLIETKDDVSATTNFGSCWSDETFHVTLSSTPDSGLLLQQIKCRDREFSLSYLGSSQKVHSLISSSRSPAHLVTLSTPPLQLLEMIERTSSYTTSRLTASKYHFLLAYDKVTAVMRKCLAGKHGFHLATTTPSASSSSIKINSKASRRAQLKLRGLNTFSGIIVQLTKALMDLFKKIYRILDLLKHLETILKLKFPEPSTKTKKNNNNNNFEDNMNFDETLDLNSKSKTKDEEENGEIGKTEDENEEPEPEPEPENLDANAPINENKIENANEPGNEDVTTKVENNNNDIDSEALKAIKSLIRPFAVAEAFGGGENSQSRQKFLDSILQDIDNILEMGKISLEGLHMKSPDVKVGKGLKKTMDVLWKALVQLDKQHDVDFGTLVISMVCNVEMIITRFNDPGLNGKSSNNDSTGESRSDFASPTTSTYSNPVLLLPPSEFGILPLSRNFCSNIRKLEENILNIYSLCKRMDILASHLATKSLHKLKMTQALEKARTVDKHLNQAQNRIPWYKRFRYKKSTDNMKTCSMIMLNTIQKTNEEIKCE